MGASNVLSACVWKGPFWIGWNRKMAMNHSLIDNSIEMQTAINVQRGNGRNNR